MRIQPEIHSTPNADTRLDASRLSTGSEVLKNPVSAGPERDYVEPAVDMSAIEKLLTSGLLDTKSFKLTCGDYNL